MRCWLWGSLLIAGAVPLSVAAQDQFEEPLPIEVAGKPLDVERMGHAAPFVGDIDGDGVKDLLVGEYYRGQMRIYRNLGTNSMPRFEGYTLLRDGDESGCVWAS